MAWFQVSFFSSALLHSVPVNVLLPDRMGRKEGEKCRTLYLLNGFRGDHTDWLLNTDVNGWSRLYDCAIVMPSGENSAYMDHAVSGTKYGEYIGKELVDFTRKSFPLSDRREDTAVAGLSMGEGKPLPQLHISCGYNDQLAASNRKYHEFLDSIGFPHTYEEGPGSHEWAFWRWGLPRALDLCGWKQEHKWVNPMWVELRDEQYLAPEWRDK